jgi:hypothetical protein
MVLFLECDTVYFGIYLATFRKNLLVILSGYFSYSKDGMEAIPSTETFVPIYQTTRRYATFNRNLNIRHRENIIFRKVSLDSQLKQECIE